MSDTGTGIPEDKVSQVFERFTKLDAKRQGTGLGLSISRTIIKKWVVRLVLLQNMVKVLLLVCSPGKAF